MLTHENGLKYSKDSVCVWGEHDCHRITESKIVTYHELVPSSLEYSNGCSLEYIQVCMYLNYKSELV